MKRKEKEKREIISLIEEELNRIDELLAELTQCKDNTRIFRRAKGSILQDFYNASERIFKIIARRLNGGVPLTESWHRELLHQMTVEIKGIRPAVISKTLASELSEYLAFRHIFRNIYGFELDSDKLDRLVEKFEKVAKNFESEIKDFLKKL